MSIFKPVPETHAKSHSVVGKVAIGVPVDEPVLVSDAIVGLKVSGDYVPARVRSGTTLQQKHVDALVAAGVKEVHVVYGGFPQKLEHFRITRRSDLFPGKFVADPAINESAGLDLTPRVVPIIFPIDDIERVLLRRMKNYDAKNGRMFCSSDGETYNRAVIEEKKYTGDYKTGVCVPQYGDVRGPICPFRDKQTSAGSALPCKFAGSLYFNLLSKDLSRIDLGQFFKLETTSIPSAEYLINGLLNIRRQFGTIAFVPCQLEIRQEEAVTPGGTKTIVPRIGISSSLWLQREYREVIEEMREIMSFYAVTDEIIDEIDEAAFDSEFRPDVRRAELAQSGLLDGADAAKAIQQAPASMVAGDAVAGADDLVEMLVYGEEFSIRLQALDTLARQLTRKQYRAYLGTRDRVTPASIAKFEKAARAQIDTLTENEKQSNFDSNTLAQAG